MTQAYPPTRPSMVRGRRDLLKYLGVTAISALAMNTGCQSKTETSVTGRTGLQAAGKKQVRLENNILTVAYSSLPRQFDPAFLSSAAGIQLCMTLFDGLVGIDHKLQPYPMLAVGWEASDDYQQWTFELRQGVFFHHGTELSATDVVYSFQRILDPKLRSPLRVALRFIETVEAVDDRHVRFNLTVPHTELPLSLGAAQARIIAKDYPIEQLRTAPSGTGPFQIDEPPTTSEITFIPNARYWANNVPGLLPGQQQATFGRLRFVQIADPQAQLAALRDGTVDILPDISPEHASELTAIPDLAIHESPSGSYHTVVMRTTAAPFDDVRVRQALKYSLDREHLQQQILYGHGEQATDHPVATVNPFCAKLPIHTQDLALARQLLEDAGYPDGIQVDLVVADISPGALTLCTQLQKQAAAVGIQIEIITVPEDTYWSNYWTNAPFHIGSWAFRASIDETLSLAHHSESDWNESGWSSAALDALLDEARAAPDIQQRIEMYHQIQEMIMNEGAVVIPYFRPVIMAVHRRVQGLIPHPASWVNLQALTLTNYTQL